MQAESDETIASYIHVIEEQKEKIASLKNTVGNIRRDYQFQQLDLQVSEFERYLSDKSTECIEEDELSLPLKERDPHALATMDNSSKKFNKFIHQI